MQVLALSAFAFLAGITLAGMAGSVMELATGRRIAFTEPFISQDHVLRSLAVIGTAGPLMLGNDALAAFRRRRLSAAALLSCGAAAVLWATAAGLVLLYLAATAAAALP